MQQEVFIYNYNLLYLLGRCIIPISVRHNIACYSCINSIYNASEMAAILVQNLWKLGNKIAAISMEKDALQMLNVLVFFDLLLLY